MKRTSVISDRENSLSAGKSTLANVMGDERASLDVCVDLNDVGQGLQFPEGHRTKSGGIRQRLVLPWSLKSVVLLSVLSEIVHGWLTHTLGTEFYARFSVGEVVKGAMLPLLVWATLRRANQFRNQMILCAMVMVGVLAIVQVVLGFTTLSEVPATIFFGLRFFFGLMFFTVVRDVLPRGTVLFERWIRFLKATFLSFYSAPILLATFGLLGFARGDRDFAFEGLIMNHNDVGVVMLALAPFFFSWRGPIDALAGLVFFVSALLLGARTVYLGFAFELLAGCVLAVCLRPRGRRSRTTTFAVVTTALTFAAFLGAAILFFASDRGRQLSTGLISGLAAIGGAGSGGQVADVARGLVVSERREGAEQFLLWLSNPRNIPGVLVGGGAKGFGLRTEIDPIDILVGLGLPMLVLIYSFWFAGLRSIWKRKWFPNRTRSVISLTFVIIASAVSGHALWPAAGVFVGAVAGASLAGGQGGWRGRDNSVSGTI